MALDGNGTYSPPAPQFPAISGTVISSDDYNQIILDIATAISTAIFRDGQAIWTGDQNAGTKSITNLTSLAGKTAGMSLSSVTSITALAAGGALQGAWAFSDSVTVPTKTPGTNTTDAASCAFVQQKAFQTALPNQTGNSEKFVTTDGVNASWASPFPAQAGNSGKFLTTNGTAAKWAYAGISTINSTITTSTTLTGTYLYVPVQMTSLGQSITLHNATTLSTGGPQYIIDNSKGGLPSGIRDNTGTLLMAVAPGGVAYVSLKDNSTAAGVWSITGSNLEPGLITIDSTFSSTYASTVLAPFVALDNNTSIHFAALSSGFAAFVVDNTGKGLTTPVTVSSTASDAPKQVFKITATTAIVFYGDGNAAGSKAVVLSLSGASPSYTLSVGTPQTYAQNGGSTWGGEDFVSAPKITQLTSTLYVASHASTAPVTACVAVSVSGTTVTIGTAANIITTNSVASSTTTYALTATTALVLYKSGAAAPYQNNAVVISVSGVACTVGTPVGSFLTSTNAATPISCYVSPTKVFIGDDYYTTKISIAALTISGTSVSAGTPVDVETGISSAMSSGYTTNSATRYNPHLWKLTTGATNTVGLWYCDSSSISRVVVLSETGGTITAGTILYRSISAAAVGSAGSGFPMPQSSTELCSVIEIASAANGYKNAAVPCKISGTAITTGRAIPLGDAFPSNPRDFAAAKVNGKYVVFGSTQTVASGCCVFSSNGDAISNFGIVTTPAGMIYGTAGPLPFATIGSQVCALMVTNLGTTVGASTYQLRLLNVEIAA